MWRTFKKWQGRVVCFDGEPAGGNGALETPPAAPPADTVTLTKQEYSEMTSAIASMRTALEALVEDRPAQPQQPPYEQPQIDAMSNNQLLQLVGEHVNRVVNESRQPLIDALATIAVKEELRDVKGAHPDFDTYAPDIQAMASKSPNLSLEQCYVLVKAGKPAPPAPPAAPDTKKVPTPADRGGVPGSTVTNQKGMSIREAAEAALASIKYE